MTEFQPRRASARTDAARNALGVPEVERAWQSGWPLGQFLATDHMKRLIAALALAAASPLAWTQDMKAETRYCGTPARDAAGNIKRSRAVEAAFQRIHPCPSTGKKSGACPGWSINHTIPLACGGCDAVSNMDWMPNDTKSCASDHCRDRWERKVYAADPRYPGTPACRNQIIK